MIKGKVWGQTEALVQTPVAELHRIDVKAGGECSLHKHNHKFNYFYIIEGTMEIEVHKNDYDLVDITTLSAGQGTSVSPGEFHKFRALTDVVALELYYPELLSEDIERKNVGFIDPEK